MIFGVAMRCSPWCPSSSSIFFPRSLGFLAKYWSEEGAYLFDLWPRMSNATAYLSHYWIFAEGANAILDGIAIGVVDYAWAQRLFDAQANASGGFVGTWWSVILSSKWC